MKGTMLTTLLVLTGCLLWSPFSYADELIIKYSSGKTQRVTLEEPMDAVIHIQAQTTGAETGETGKNAGSHELYSKDIRQKDSDSRMGKKEPEDKKSIRLKWGTPKLGE